MRHRIDSKQFMRLFLSNISPKRLVSTMNDSVGPQSRTVRELDEDRIIHLQQSHVAHKSQYSIFVGMLSFGVMNDVLRSGKLDVSRSAGSARITRLCHGSRRMCVLQHA